MSKTDDFCDSAINVLVRFFAVACCVVAAVVVSGTVYAIILLVYRLLTALTSIH